MEFHCIIKNTKPQPQVAWGKRSQRTTTISNKKLVLILLEIYNGTLLCMQPLPTPSSALTLHSLCPILMPHAQTSMRAHHFLLYSTSAHTLIHRCIRIHLSNFLEKPEFSMTKTIIFLYSSSIIIHLASFLFTILKTGFTTLSSLPYLNLRTPPPEKKKSATNRSQCSVALLLPKRIFYSLFFQTLFLLLIAYRPSCYLLPCSLSDFKYITVPKKNLYIPVSDSVCGMQLCICYKKL